MSVNEKSANTKSANAKKKIGVLGASGYTGADAVRLLSRIPAWRSQR